MSLDMDVSIAQIVIYEFAAESFVAGWTIYLSIGTNAASSHTYC